MMICVKKKKENNKIYISKKAKINHLGGKSHSPIYEKKLNFHETGIGCGQNFILIKNILVI